MAEVIVKINNKVFNFGDLSESATTSLMKQHQSMLNSIKPEFDPEISMARQIQVLHIFTNIWQTDKSVWEYLSKAEDNKTENVAKLSIDGEFCKFKLPDSDRFALVMYNNEFGLNVFDVYQDIIVMLDDSEPIEESDSGVTINDKTYLITMSDIPDTFILILIDSEGNIVHLNNNILSTEFIKLTEEETEGGPSRGTLML